MCKYRVDKTANCRAYEELNDPTTNTQHVYDVPATTTAVAEAQHNDNA